MNNYKINKLKNGLQIIKTNLPHYKTCSIIASVKTGSKNENDKNNGVAHFLEHINFKGTKTYKNTHELSKILNSMGCSFNAYTMRYVTTYHFKVAYNVEYIDKILHIVSEMLFAGLLRKKDIEKERNIILEEINQTYDDPDNCIDDYVAEMMFEGSPLAMTVLGDIKVVKTMKESVVRQFYDKYYVPNNVIMSISGKIPHNINKMIQQYFNKYPSVELKTIPIIPYIFKSSKPQLKVITKKNAHQCNINISFPAFSITDKRVYPLELLALHFAGNMSSILYQELRTKNNLVYDVDADINTYEEGGYITISTAVDPKNLNKTIEIILYEANKLFLDDFGNLEILKTNQIHSAEMDWEDSYNVADHYLDQLMLYSKITNIKEHYKMYKKVTVSDIKSVVKDVIDFRRMKVVIIGNIKQKDINLEKMFKSF